jgi:HAD superfamily hydrolase (TIGR01509 family)
VIHWDFDGTVCDTERPAYAFCKRIFERFGIELTMDIYTDADGKVRRFSTLLDQLELNVGSKLDRELIIKEREEEKRRQASQTKVLPGVERLMREAKQLQIFNVIVSSGSKDWIESQLKLHALNTLIDLVVSREIVGALTKPNPALYIEAGQRINIPPELGVAIEDSTIGCVAARKANLKVVGVTTGVTSHDKLEQVAHRVVASVESLTLENLNELLATRQKNSNLPTSTFHPKVKKKNRMQKF